MTVGMPVPTGEVAINERMKSDVGCFQRPPCTGWSKHQTIFENR